ncbi:FAD-dependent oxidoreductase [Thermophilibacter immobilis]|uniref:FAD-dependent oxidoreductase n=1 Tax=Thermophilibacter immobilis TaxID=2779519 RepID=A0A7S7M8W8_9ACTN|nr:FAD-dependent oxidoreductase [Thermophilibacter immobilis]QOY60851.1 FAD-dependent oxidoreductase [Thermophilibacter immobilis]
MSEKKIVIIGGVAGGATAAARLRRLDERAHIVILERSGYVSYANCGLPYYVGGTITDRSKLTLQTPESFRARFNIDVHVHQEAVSIDRAQQVVHVRNLEDKSTYDEPYDELILSPGARAVVPPLPGVDSERLFTLRTVEDTFAIHDFIERAQAKRATVVGAGFIGLEMTENLCERGIDVTLVQRDPQAMLPIDADMAPFVHNELRRNGVELHLNATVTGFVEKDDALVTQLADGQKFAADLVILAIGVTPDSTLAKDAGLELGLRGSIRVDEHLRTSDSHIFAVGDAIEVRHVVTGRPALIALAGPANKQGRIAADNICGRKTTFTGSQGSSVLKLFDLTITSTGLNARQAAQVGIDFDAVVLSPASHATYYPGAGSMTLKVLFERSGERRGRIIGAQIVGTDGADKRIDVLATAIRAQMGASDLTELDLAYAPPYSSAKDPVNMAGYLIENILDGLVKQVSWGEATNLPEDAVLVDVRTPGEVARGGIEGSLRIPLDELRDRTGELPRDKTLYVHCQSGLRSYVACRMLSQLGFSCANVAGGYGFYAASALDRALAGNAAGPCGMVS